MKNHHRNVLPVWYRAFTRRVPKHILDGMVWALFAPGFFGRTVHSASDQSEVGTINRLPFWGFREQASVRVGFAGY